MKYDNLIMSVLKNVYSKMKSDGHNVINYKKDPIHFLINHRDFFTCKEAASIALFIGNIMGIMYDKKGSVLGDFWKKNSDAIMVVLIHV